MVPYSCCHIERFKKISVGKNKICVFLERSIIYSNFVEKRNTKKKHSKNSLLSRNWWCREFPTSLSADKSAVTIYKSGCKQLHLHFQYLITSKCIRMADVERVELNWRVRFIYQLQFTILFWTLLPFRWMPFRRNRCVNCGAIKVVQTLKSTAKASSRVIDATFSLLNSNNMHVILDSFLWKRNFCSSNVSGVIKMEKIRQIVHTERETHKIFPIKGSLGFFILCYIKTLSLYSITIFLLFYPVFELCNSPNRRYAYKNDI